MREANVRRLVTMTAWFTDSKLSYSVRTLVSFLRTKMGMKDKETTAKIETTVNNNATFLASTASSAPRVGFLANWILVPILRPMLTNMRQMETYLEATCPDINYTVVRPPRLSQAPKTGG